MEPGEINQTLEANPQAAKLLTAEYQARSHGTTPEEIRALVAEEIRFRLRGFETAVDQMQADAS